MNLFLDSMMYLNPVPEEAIDFRALLDSTSITVCFIAAALGCKSSHRSERTVVMTDDIDAQLRCSHWQIETAHLPFQIRNPRFAASDQYAHL
jgi:hypothetical protein